MRERDGEKKCKGLSRPGLDFNRVGISGFYIQPGVSPAPGRELYEYSILVNIHEAGGAANPGRALPGQRHRHRHR